MSKTDDRTTARSDWEVVAASPFVLLGTYRKTGELVETTVWIAPDGDDLVVTSERSVGKIKRLRNDPRVQLRPCGRFGEVEPGAVTVQGRMIALRDPDDDRGATKALHAKYGWQYTAILGVERFVRRIQRKDGHRLIIRLAPAAPPPAGTER